MSSPHAAVRALERLGWATTEDIRDELAEDGYWDGLVWRTNRAGQMVEVRRLIKQINRGQRYPVIVSAMRYTPDGRRERYYKYVSGLTLEDTVQLAGEWHRSASHALSMVWFYCYLAFTRHKTLIVLSRYTHLPQFCSRCHRWFGMQVVHCEVCGTHRLPEEKRCRECAQKEAMQNSRATGLDSY